MREVALVSMAALPDGAGWTVRRFVRHPHGALEVTHQGATSDLTPAVVSAFRVVPPTHCAITPPRLVGLGL